MKNIYLVVFLYCSSYSFSQEIRTIEEFIFERHLRDSVSYDTLVKSIKTYDAEGRLTTDKIFDTSGNIKNIRIYVSPSLEVMFLGEPNADSIGAIKYHYDQFHNVVMITNSGYNIDTMKYSTLYSDSLILKRVCIEGCNDSEIYEYDSLGRLSIVKEIFPNRTYLESYEYDTNNRLIKWTSEFGSTIISTNYSLDGLTTIEKYCSIKDPSNCWNTTITQYNSEGQMTFKEFYLNDKLSYKSYFIYSMW